MYALEMFECSLNNQQTIRAHMLIQTQLTHTCYCISVQISGNKNIDLQTHIEKVFKSLELKHFKTPQKVRF